MLWHCWIVWMCLAVFDCLNVLEQCWIVWMCLGSVEFPEVAYAVFGCLNVLEQCWIAWICGCCPGQYNIGWLTTTSVRYYRIHWNQYVMRADFFSKVVPARGFLLKSGAGARISSQKWCQNRARGFLRKTGAGARISSQNWCRRADFFAKMVPARGFLLESGAAVSWKWNGRLLQLKQ